MLSSQIAAWDHDMVDTVPSTIGRNASYIRLVSYIGSDTYVYGGFLADCHNPPSTIDNTENGQKYSIHNSKNGAYFMHSFADAASHNKRGLPNSIDLSYVFNLHSFFALCIISQLMERENSLREIVCLCGKS